MFSRENILSTILEMLIAALKTKTAIIRKLFLTSPFFQPKFSNWLFCPYTVNSHLDDNL